MDGIDLQRYMMNKLEIIIDEIKNMVRGANNRLYKETSVNGNSDSRSP